MSRTITLILPSASPQIQITSEEIATGSLGLPANNGTLQPQAYTTPNGLITAGLGPPPPAGAPVRSPLTVNTRPATPPLEPPLEAAHDERTLRSFLEENARQMNLKLVLHRQGRASSIRRGELPTYAETIEHQERAARWIIIDETDESDEAQSERGMSSVSDPLRGRERSRQVGRRRRRSPPPLRRSTRSRCLLPPGREVDTYAYPIESVITDPTTTHWPLGYPPYIGYPLQPYGGYMSQVLEYLTYQLGDTPT